MHFSVGVEGAVSGLSLAAHPFFASGAYWRTIAGGGGGQEWSLH
jgi:hypothetical protein